MLAGRDAWGLEESVTPPFMKGNKEDMENHMFVSLISIYVKMMEKILWEIFSKYWGQESVWY